MVRKLVATVAVLVVWLLPAPQAALGASEDSCARNVAVDFTYGVPTGWDVETLVNEDGGSAWHRTDDPIVRGWLASSQLAGGGARDDRLISAPFIATSRSAVTFVHDLILGDQAGGVLEASVGGGEWTAVPVSRFEADGPTGSFADGQPAFRGAHVDNFVGGELESVVDLSHLAGSSVRLAWRLRADASGTPGHWTISDFTFARVADGACVDGSRPQTRCATDVGVELSTGVPAGWTVDTAVNADQTPAWDAGPRGVSTIAAGTGAKDDRLVSAPFEVTESTVLGMRHDYDTEGGFDGGVLEVSTDDGSTWADVGAERFLLGAYDGTLAGGRPAWTGVSPLNSEQAADPTGYFSSASLGHLAGETVQVRWRLLQDAARSNSAPGVEWYLRGIHLDDVVTDAACVPIDDEEEEDVRTECNSLDPPEHAAVAGVTDSGAPVRLDVRVALDVAEGASIAKLQEQGRVDEAQARMADLEAEARAILEPGAAAYDDLGIELSLTFDLLAPLNPDGTPRERTGGSDELQLPDVSDERQYYDELFDLAYEQYDLAAPEGADVVYVATDLPLGGPAGIADCVGGIAKPDHAFAVGHLYRGPQGSMIIADDPGARVFAHEVAHLLGAQHHLSNCVESAPEWAPQADTTGMCTLMSPDIFLTWLKFSTPNGAIVRGYATEYAAANDD